MHVKAAMIESLALAMLICSQAKSQTVSKAGVDLTAIDKDQNPCENFYQYACGEWRKSHPIPNDESSWSRFSELHERNQLILKQILEDAAKNQSRSAIDGKIGAYYGSCIDEAEIEKRGVKPLEPELARISQMGDKGELTAVIARLQRQQVFPFFLFASSPDLKNARLNIAGLDQGGLGLPERDYYFRTDPKSVELRQKYVATIAKMFTLIGVSPEIAAQKASTVMALETDLAKASLDVTSRRDPQKLFHDMTPEAAAKLSPNLDLMAFFAAVGAPKFDTVNVAVPQFFKAVSDIVGSRPIADIQDYLSWQYIHASAPLLTSAFVDENFNFYGRTLLGTKELRPRWKRCVSSTDEEIGDALGQKYVEKTFGEQGKQRTLQMVGEIEHEMAADLQSLSWMSPATKQAALVKLRAVTNKIGYPDKWRDYSSLKILPDDYFGNFYRANEYEHNRDMNKIGKPVDKTEWGMTPPTVNAYYDPAQNNINFPAGILQPPFYSNSADDAVNYGAIGAVVGHELTHGFDDEGRQFDADGNLRDWWQASDEQAFNKLADCTVHEYDGFSPLDGVHLNGRLTLGENTADNGGLRLAYMALMDSLARKALPADSGAQSGGEYSDPRKFFLGFAQVWCENTRPETARFLAQTNPHSPGEFRTNGVVHNMPEFSQAFACKPKDPLYIAKGQGCRVW